MNFINPINFCQFNDQKLCLMVNYILISLSERGWERARFWLLSRQLAGHSSHSRRRRACRSVPSQPRGWARARLLGQWQMAPVNDGFLCFQNIMQEKPGPSGTAGGNVKWCGSYGKRFGGSSKHLKYVFQHSHVCVRTPKIQSRDSRRYSHVHVYGSFIHNSQDVQVPKSLSIGREMAKQNAVCTHDGV